MRFLIFGVLLLFTGCCRQFLEVRSEYLTPAYLSSVQLDTPDPCRRCFWGQQVIVHWNIPKRMYVEGLEIFVTLRFGNRELHDVTFPVDKPFGYWIYRLANADYWRKCGILSYKVDLLHNGVCIDSWRHHVWTDLIHISH